MYISSEGFREYDESLVGKLIEYHNANGRLSRFNKIQYFYNEILNTHISENKIQEYAKAFSRIIKGKGIVYVDIF